MLFRSSSSSGKPNYRVIASCKKACIGFEKDFRYSILRSFHSYFGQPFADCALELRHLFYPKGEDEDFTSPTYDAFLGIFENLKNGLPDMDPDPIPEPGAWIYEEVAGLPYYSQSVVEEETHKKE